MPRPKKILLSPNRKKWLGNRNTNLIGSTLNHNISLQDRYARMLTCMVDGMAKEYRSEVLRFFKAPDVKNYFAIDSSISHQAQMMFNHLDAKFRRQFKAVSSVHSKSIISDINIYSRTSVNRSLSKIAGGLTIDTDFITDDMNEMMKSFRYENQQLTLDLEQTYTKNIRADVLESIRKKDSGGISALIDRIERTLSDEQKKVHNRARNIAHDQTRRAYNNLNAGRMQAVGVNEYRWVHSKGGFKPRLYHMNVLDGNIFKLDDPPIIDEKTGERGKPGDLIGCKCSMLPIISFGNVTSR